MIIEEKDFRLEYEEAGNRFDLYLLQIVNAKDADKRREEFKLHGYGMTMEHALKVIINTRLKNKKEVFHYIVYKKLIFAKVTHIKNDLKIFVCCNFFQNAASI